MAMERCLRGSVCAEIMEIKKQTKKKWKNYNWGSAVHSVLKLHGDLLPCRIERMDGPLSDTHLEAILHKFLQFLHRSGVTWSEWHFLPHEGNDINNCISTAWQTADSGLIELGLLFLFFGCRGWKWEKGWQNIPLGCCIDCLDYQKVIGGSWWTDSYTRKPGNSPLPIPSL